MTNNFLKALKFTLAWEGGFVNDPQDSGGATNQGVTQGTYNAYRLQNGRDPKRVEDITDDEIVDIYRTQFWDKLNCDALPAGLDIAAFDFAVNSGVGRVLSYLASHPRATAGELIDYRENFLKSLISRTRFLKGWLNRTEALRALIQTIKE